MSLHALVSELDSEADRYAERRDLPEGMPDNLAHAMGSVYRACAKCLSAALADGGEAVAWMVVKDCYYHFGSLHTVRDHAALERDLKAGRLKLLYEHPAGAVKLTEEMVENAWIAFFRSQCDGHASRINMRAALEVALNPGGSRE